MNIQLYTFLNGKFYHEGKELKMFRGPNHLRVNTPHGQMLAHRLLWAIKNGGVPADKYVIAKDSDYTNLVIDNFFLGNESNNRRGKKKEDFPHKKGCHFHVTSGKWYARASVNYQQYFLGSFETEEEAHGAYKAFKAAQKAKG